jgi:hypothetical protein
MIAWKAAAEAIESGRLEEAQEKVQTFLKTCPATDEMRFALLSPLAYAFMERGDLDRARTWAAQSTAYGPHPETFSLLGDIAGKSGDLEGALEWYEAACALPDKRSRFFRLVYSPSERRQKVAALRAALAPPPVSLPPPERYFFIVPCHNAGPWIEKCLTSIEGQDRRNFRVVVADDCSDDDTAVIAQRFVRAAPERFALIRNGRRLWALENIVRAIRASGAGSEDVIFRLDGDDWLARSDVLDVVHRVYTSCGAWMTYGSFVQSDGQSVWSRAYPRAVADRGLHRAYCAWGGFLPLALTTFRRFLFDPVKDDDLKDADGTWPKLCYDVALFVPMLEMAREHAIFVPDRLYVYNVDNSQSDYKIFSPQEQVETRERILGRPVYQRLVYP